MHVFEAIKSAGAPVYVEIIVFNGASLSSESSSATDDALENPESLSGASDVGFWTTVGLEFWKEGMGMERDGRGASFELALDPLAESRVRSSLEISRRWNLAPIAVMATSPAFVRTKTSPVACTSSMRVKMA